MKYDDIIGRLRVNALGQMAADAIEELSEQRSGSNIYETTFNRHCPDDGALIEYRLRMHAEETIMVEAINAAISKIPDPIHQEDAVDVLADEMPEAVFTVEGIHQGVKITCYR